MSQSSEPHNPVTLPDFLGCMFVCLCASLAAAFFVYTVRFVVFILTTALS
jgi:hypothetical protein